ncbi:hypothetical protein BLNAU_12121 [Blattamonas nauphoetae]|uniref:Uncharacterized protein n=1 Tax=Blattamonas nauphoetae TaxID=2049346 RepID=A0ABQ9XRN9_9EUKA|nr:hypothetical protein BLNAU_12121 [Blattamonas nauphoetae]
MAITTVNCLRPGRSRMLRERGNGLLKYNHDQLQKEDRTCHGHTVAETESEASESKENVVQRIYKCSSDSIRVHANGVGVDDSDKKERFGGVGQDGVKTLEDTLIRAISSFLQQEAAFMNKRAQRERRTTRRRDRRKRMGTMSGRVKVKAKCTFSSHFGREKASRKAMRAKFHCSTPFNSIVGERVTIIQIEHGVTQSTGSQDSARAWLREEGKGADTQRVNATREGGVEERCAAK